MANEYRVTTVALETLRDGPSSARVSSFAIEVLRATGSATTAARITSVGIEVLRTVNAASAGRRRQCAIVN